MKVFLIAALCYCCYSAPLPFPLEEEFSMPGFNAQKENHEEKFLRVDSNKDKKLDFNEFLHMELAYVEAKREEFDSLDEDKDGIVTQKEYEEHYQGVTSKSEARRSEYFAKLFQDFDEDLDMSLNKDEMERVLAARFLAKPRENFPKLFYAFDHDHSGGLDLLEYMKFDADFPFDQTDPISSHVSKKQKPAGQKNSNRGTVAATGVPFAAQRDGADAESLAQAMASRTLTKVQNTVQSKASFPDKLSAQQETGLASGLGLHLVETGSSRLALPKKKKIAKETKSI